MGIIGSHVPGMGDSEIPCKILKTLKPAAKYTFILLSRAGYDDPAVQQLLRSGEWTTLPTDAVNWEALVDGDCSHALALMQRWDQVD